LKAQSTLTEYIASPDDADLARYQAILADIRADLETYPPPLQDLARPIFEGLASSEMSQVIALLPYWLTDLLPVPAETSHRLGMAHLYGWWYYYVQDELLDQDAPASMLLAGHLALLKMVEGYRTLGVTYVPGWAEFETLAITSAACHAVEIETRFTDLSALTPKWLVPWTVEFLIQRAGPFYFNTMAQLHLAGIPPEAPLRGAVMMALRHFGAVRQLGDDSGDWLDDLKQGRLNYVSAQLMRRLYDLGLANSGLDLDPERLAGYQLTDEVFWAELEETARTLAHQALEALKPYSPCRLQALIEGQLKRNLDSWAVARTRRARLRQLFGLEQMA
jgi:hypothetical protein